MNITYEYKGSEYCAELCRELWSLVHFHRHIEIVYIIEGKAKAYCDFKEYSISSGDVFISFPNQIHYYHNTNPIEAILIIVPMDFFVDYSQILFSKTPESSVIYSACQNKELIDLINAIYKISGKEVPYQKEIIRGYSSALMGILLGKLELCDSKNDITDSLHSILTFCENNYKNYISLDTVADELNLSKYYISRIFSNKIKIGFNDFINNLRIDEACRLLKNSESSITDIAYEVGFGSIRSFNRAFEKFMSCNPRDYQKSRKKSTAV